MNFPILSTLIFLPLVSSIFIFLSKGQKNNASAIYVSLFSSLATFILSIFLWYSLDLNSSDFQFIEEKSWINDFIFIKPLKRIGIFFWKKGDQDTIDRFGPDGVSKVIKYISNKAVQFQSGYIYDYAFVMLIGLSILLTYLILI